jgi:CRP-like cAMP-binding protein
VQKIQDRKLDDIVNFMHKLPYFAKWSHTALRKLCACYQLVKYSKGETVCRIGDPCRYVYIVNSGEFEVRSEYRHSIRKETELLTLIGPRKQREALRLRYARVGPRPPIGQDCVEVKQTLQACIDMYSPNSWSCWAEGTYSEMSRLSKASLTNTRCAAMLWPANYTDLQPRSTALQRA